ncbi:hypothetical protein V6N12_000653 [Hibiscus sabdariffa]|uniref:Transmembrane protein n=1 Tax=Hibiscus sabdariffa TaxID=183260 RepID=A0ABR2AL45_9ROSI
MRKRSLHVSGAKLPKGRPISCLLLFACSGGAAFAEFVEIEAKQHLALPRVLCRRRGGFFCSPGSPLLVLPPLLQTSHETTWWKLIFLVFFVALSTLRRIFTRPEDDQREQICSYFNLRQFSTFIASKAGHETSRLRKT